MKNFDEAVKSIKRVTFTEDQRSRSKKVYEAAESFLLALWEGSNNVPSADLTNACRSVELATMWSSKAISNESKGGI